MTAFDDRLHASPVDYTYDPPTGGGGPHAVHTAGEYEYSYDAAGNVQTRTNELAGIDQSFTYSGALHLPTRIDWAGETESFTSEIEYSPGGARTVKRRRSADSTIQEELIYVGDELQVTDKPDGSVEYAYNIFGGTALLARVIVDEPAAGMLTGRRTELALTDRLGTVVTTVDGEDGALLGMFSPTPYGASEQTPPDFGFTSHRHEQELGLIDMRARLYDPAIGRFLSPDPITATPFSSQAVNAYSYVSNSPLNFTDPTGLCPVIMKSPYDWVVDCTLGREARERAERQARDQAASQYRYEAGSAANYHNSQQQRPPAPPGAPTAPAGSGQGGPGDSPDEWNPSPSNQLLLTLATPPAVSTLRLTREYAGDPAELSVVPGVGEAMDCCVIADPASSPLARFLASVSLSINIALPILPNFGATVARGGTDAIQPYWPPNRGFLHPPTQTTLSPGTRVDRFGHEGGTFVAPEGTPFGLRGLPPENASKAYGAYEVIKPLDVNAGTAAPAFGGGLGPQYELPGSVEALIRSGHLRRIQ